MKLARWKESDYRATRKRESFLGYHSSGVLQVVSKVSHTLEAISTQGWPHGLYRVCLESKGLQSTVKNS